MQNILWVSLLLLLFSSLMKRSILSVLGWILFGLFWLGQPSHYLELDDYFNAILSLVASIFCFYMAWMVLCRGFRCKACFWASYAAAICGIIYFPFSEIDSLQHLLIGLTTIITTKILLMMSVPVTNQSWNTLTLNGQTVEIVLACTAIESIALFAGVILSVRAPLGRRMCALVASAVIIYCLNIIRNAFVLMAFGWEWFGSESFEIAHNIIAKAGSTFALLAVAYLVFMFLPELLEVIDELMFELWHLGRGAA